MGDFPRVVELQGVADIRHSLAHTMNMVDMDHTAVSRSVR